MAKIQKNFVKGRMNKSFDERLVPQGEYIDALNVRLGSTESTEIGAVENSKGNSLVVELSFKNSPLSVEAKCIGAYEDGANETIYWFVHDKANTLSSTGKVDLIVSYNTRTFVLFYHVVSTSVLNFDKDYLINGINLIGDLLFFTDNLNAPRKINVTRTYLQPNSSTVDLLTEQDIGVIVKPPLNAPEILQFEQGGGENYMEELLLSFAYRWQYEDGEYSALSPFSEYAFTAGPYNFNYSNYNQEGMRNVFNGVKITFDTGGRNVLDVDLVFKFSTSTSVNVVERFNKVNEGWLDDSQQTFVFTNKKVYTALPEEQLLRLYDNVPRIAQAQTIMGNRLMYGNYIDGYNIKNESGADIYLDYDLELISERLDNDEITGVLSNYNYSINGSVPISSAKVTIDFGDSDLKVGSQIGVAFNYRHASYNGDSGYDDGNAPQNEFVYTWIFQLQNEYSSIYDMATSPEFISAVSEFIPLNENQCLPIYGGSQIGSSLTDNYVCGVQSKSGWEFIGFGTSGSPQGFGIEASQGSTELSFIIPSLKFEEYDQTLTPPQPTGKIAYEYLTATNAEGLYSADSSKGSLHSNRDYEVAIVYMDEYGRASTALVDTNNTIFVPCDRSVYKNNIRVKLNSVPPYWATKYKFVLKESKGLYRTIYSNIFFQEEETGDIYYLLDGDNIDKVKDKGVLYVKSDTNGPVINCASTKVLGYGSQSKDFLCEKDADGEVISGTCGQPSGVYMKLKATNFAANKPPNSFIEEKSDSHGSYSFSSVPLSIVDVDNPNEKVPFDVPAGSIINLEFYATRRHRGSKCGGRDYLYNKKFTSSQDYDSVYDWVIGDNIDFTNGVHTGSDDTINQENQYNDIKPYPTYLATGGQSYMGFQSNGTPGNWGNNDLFLCYQTGTPNCGSPNKRNSYTRVFIQVERASTLTVFETEPLETNDELYYENEQSFDIVNGYHMSGNSDSDQDQTVSLPAIIDLTFFNCFSFGNGVESNHVLDGLIKPMVELGEKVTSVSEEQYKETHRFSDITYSGVFNQETNLNKLNQFNLALTNFKTLETSYGPVRKMHARETDILSLQEDKISYVLVGKNLLSDAASGGAITSVPEVLGTQLARVEEYGISNNPESFASYGYDVFFTDAKRSSVIQLKGGSAKSDKLVVISESGMRSWFRDLFQNGFETQKLGGFDPYMNEFVLSSNVEKIPQPPIIRNCGYTLNITNSDSEYKMIIDYTTIIGECDIVYNVSGDVVLKVEWNESTVISQNVSGTGTLSFDKTANNPKQAEITITPVNGTASFNMEFKCPVADELVVKEIVINYEGEASLTTTCRYRWSLGTSLSPYSTNEVELQSDGVSLFEQTQGDSSFGTIPALGATVIMQNKQNPGQSFEFNPSTDKFKYLISNVNYDESDLGTLIPLLNTATPITGTSPEYQASFTYANQSNYIYLVWDLRKPTLLEFCYDESDINDVCCECGDQPEPTICREYQSIPYDGSIQIVYRDCNGEIQSIIKTCSGVICQGETFCATEIISSNETVNPIGFCNPQ